MTLMRILALLLAACALGYGASAQVIVRDHRLGKETKYIPRPQRPVVLPPAAKPPVPATIAGFTVDNTFHPDVMTAPGRSAALLTSGPGQVIFGNRLQLGTGTISTSPNDPMPREVMFYVDTLTIDGPCTIDLSLNKPNENGFLFISCRILDLKSGGQLSVNLSGGQGDKYRKFFLFAQQIFLDGRKVFDEAAALLQFIKHSDPPILYWHRLRVGEAPPPGLPPGSIKDGKILDTLKSNPLQLFAGYLPAMRDENPAFFTFFSRWVEESYKDIQGQIARNRNNKMLTARQYIRLEALNNYSGLEPPYQDRCTALVEQINSQKDKDFKNGFQFERTVSIGTREIRMLSSLKDDAVVNYIPLRSRLSARLWKTEGRSPGTGSLTKLCPTCRCWILTWFLPAIHG